MTAKEIRDIAGEHLLGNTQAEVWAAHDEAGQDETEEWVIDCGQSWCKDHNRHYIPPDQPEQHVFDPGTDESGDSGNCAVCGRAIVHHLLMPLMEHHAYRPSTPIPGSGCDECGRPASAHYDNNWLHASGQLSRTAPKIATDEGEPQGPVSLNTADLDGGDGSAVPEGSVVSPGAATVDEPVRRSLFNRHDPSECDACEDIDGICDFHEGHADGVWFMSKIIRVALDDPERMWPLVLAKWAGS